MSMKQESVKFLLNGEERVVNVDPSIRALDMLRNDLGLTGTKDGCGVGECGACTIVINGKAVNSCLVPVLQLDGAEIITVEGLESTDIGQVLQKAFATHGAVQCGFCTPGMLLSSYALLLSNPVPNEEEIKIAISGNLCRCTGYTPIISAIKDAAEQIAGK